MPKKPAKKLSLKKETAKRLTVDSSETDAVRAGLLRTGTVSTFTPTACNGDPNTNTQVASLCAGACG